MGNNLPANTPHDVSTTTDSQRKIFWPFGARERMSEAEELALREQQEKSGGISSIAVGLLRGVLMGMRYGMATVINVALVNLFDAPLQWFRPTNVTWQDLLNARAGQTGNKDAKLYNTWEMLVARDGYKPVLLTVGGALFANTMLGCIMFGVFEATENRLKWQPFISNKQMDPWIAGGLAGFAMSGPSTVVENIRIWALTHQKEVCSQAGRSLLQIMVTQPSHHLRQYFLLTCMRDVLSVSSFFGISYSVFENTSQLVWGEDRRTPMYKTFLAGGAAAIVSDLISIPFTRLKEERAGIFSPMKGLPIIRLYHGLNPASVVACAIPGGCALMMFEYTKRLQRGELGDSVLYNKFYNKFVKRWIN